MYEAAVAHRHATGTDIFLDVALRNAELVNSEFGWGRREIAPGHQEIEIGLIKLYRETGDTRWLDPGTVFSLMCGAGRASTFITPQGAGSKSTMTLFTCRCTNLSLNRPEAVGACRQGSIHVYGYGRPVRGYG